MALQLANIAPVLYMCYNKHQKHMTTQRAIWSVLLLGMIISVSLGAFWSVTFGTHHSIMLLIFVFFAGVVGAMTTVLFYGFVSAFPAVFTSALAVGEGCSGVVAGLIGLLQDSGNRSHLQFSIQTFFTLFGTSIPWVSCVQMHP